ncbi:MAG: MogA/MoaB family molybdenum cofactor biosynthesis protein [Thermoanaerobaculia bacterium]|nr:MogA/MoaB family molybdenum cofactor biosynthesis protein [Thermoanaerobaculia bacterium]
MPTDAVRDHRERAPEGLSFVVLTVSSSRSLEDDESGHRIAELAREDGHVVRDRMVVSDETVAIRGAARVLIGRSDVDVLVVNGGTGFSPGDLTPEAIRPLFERVIPGFGELFRSLSFEEVGAAAMLSRAVAGIAGETLVFLLPGSPAAAELAMRKLVLPEAGHLLSQMRR